MQQTLPQPLTAPTLDAEQLAALVRSVATDPRRWQDHVRFRAGERWWVRLESDDCSDVWLLTWAVDTGTDLHDHGSSAGAFTVVSGVLEEVRPAPSGSYLISTKVREGEVRRIELGAVHDVRSPSPLPAISIHAYSPPLREMTFYEHRNGATRPTRTVATRTEARP